MASRKLPLVSLSTICAMWSASMDVQTSESSALSATSTPSGYVYVQWKQHAKYYSWISWTNLLVDIIWRINFLVDLIWSTNYFFTFCLKTELWHWISHVGKHAKAHFIRVSALLNTKDMYINTFQSGGCGHIGFWGICCHFWAGYTEDLSSAPLNTPKKLVCHKLTRFAYSTLKLKCSQYPSIRTNYMISHCTTL